ncbi:MAG: 2-(1,2-epoxy-1,2-dihydrophenyl)acetyl-CoA isomerase [Paraglaciecola sp.]
MEKNNVSNSPPVTTTIDGPVAIIRFNRPEKLNAIDDAQRKAFRQAASKVNEDESIRVVILTGQGRAFSAGADLSEKMPDDLDVEQGLLQEYLPALMAITHAPKPWISAVNGPAAGIGSAFAMACDLTIMAESAYIYQAFSAIGLIPDGGATWHLAHTVGRKRAYELIALGTKLGARECLQLGLCNKVVADDALLDEALALGEQLSQKAPLALRYAKQALNEAMHSDLVQTIGHEAKLQQLCADSDDAKEGSRAFLEKRPAQFSGH